MEGCAQGNCICSFVHANRCVYAGRNAAGGYGTGRHAARASKRFGRRRASAGYASRFQRYLKQRTEPAAESAGSTAAFNQQAVVSGKDFIELNGLIRRPIAT